MRIAVIGAGGVGGYFGGRLAVAGNEVTFVARGAHFDAMRTKGLSVFSARGDMHLQPVHVVQHVNDIDTVDLVLVTVKLCDSAEWNSKGWKIDRQISVCHLSLACV